MPASLLLLVTLAASVPSINVPTVCRAAAAEVAPQERRLAFERCLHQEQDARREIPREWSKVSAATRSSCVEESTSFSPSYVDLLTCLEMGAGGTFSHGGGALNVASSPASSGSSAPASPVGFATPASPNLPQINAPSPIVGLASPPPSHPPAFTINAVELAPPGALTAARAPTGGGHR